MTVNWQGCTITPVLPVLHVGEASHSGVLGKLVKLINGVFAANPEPVTVTTVPMGPEFGDPETGRRVTVASGEKLTLGPAETKD